MKARGIHAPALGREWFCPGNLAPEAWVACAFVALGVSVHAEGFRNPPLGALDQGKAGERVAQIDDASAVQHNPANLVDLPAPELEFTPSLVYMQTDFQSPTGQRAGTINPWRLIPSACASTPLFDHRGALGVGLTLPYGFSTEWDQNDPAFTRPSGVLRYQTPYFADLLTLNINPAFAFKLGDHLQVGAGLDVMGSQLTLKQLYPWFRFSGSTSVEPDGHLETRGEGFGLGGNAGVTLRLGDHQRLALTCRSPITLRYNGDLTVDNITPTAANLGATPRSDFNTTIRFPTIIAAGYGIQLTETARLEADFEWLQFSRFKSLNLNGANNTFLLPSANIPQNWKDTFTAGVGADWRFATNWILRAGYQFYQSPVPDGTFSAMIPDSDQHVITAGIAFEWNHHSFAASYGLDFYAPRHITSDQNAAFNGNYHITAHLFSISYHYSF